MRARYLCLHGWNLSSRPRRSTSCTGVCGVVSWAWHSSRASRRTPHTMHTTGAQSGSRRAHSGHVRIVLRSSRCCVRARVECTDAEASSCHRPRGHRHPPWSVPKTAAVIRDRIARLALRAYKSTTKVVRARLVVPGGGQTGPRASRGTVWQVATGLRRRPIKCQRRVHAEREVALVFTS